MPSAGVILLCAAIAAGAMGIGKARQAVKRVPGGFKHKVVCPLTHKGCPAKAEIIVGRTAVACHGNVAEIIVVEEVK